MKRHLRHAGLLSATLLIAGAIVSGASGSLQSPEQFLGFKVGADNKLVRWDKVVEYMKLAAAGSDRVRYRELGKTSGGNPFIALEISAPDTLKNLDRYKQMERKLYFQGGAPSDSERDEIFRQGKVVLLITCSIHATEIGATQMSVELVHRLATEDSPEVKKILDNVIFVLVPSLNPDGEILVTDWFNKNVGTPYEASPIPYLYHPYVGHDNNRDMYMFTQKESEYTAQLLWHDWFPSVWLDEHQQGSNGARIFVMPATDPINVNVHPLIYRWNGILGQSQAAALEAAGKEGIIYNATYTNFWEGAMAWSGWWHNQIGLLTEVASARIAAPIDQQRAGSGRGAQRGAFLVGLAVIALAVHQQVKADDAYLAGAYDDSDVVAAIVPIGSCVVFDQPDRVLLANRFTSARSGCPPVTDPYGSYLAADPADPPPRQKLPPPAAYVEQWRGYFDASDFVVLGVPFSSYLPWTSELEAYFTARFQLVYNTSRTYVYVHAR